MGECGGGDGARAAIAVDASCEVADRAAAGGEAAVGQGIGDHKAVGMGAPGAGEADLGGAAFAIEAACLVVEGLVDGEQRAAGADVDGDGGG